MAGHQLQGREAGKQWCENNGIHKGATSGPDGPQRHDFRFYKGGIHMSPYIPQRVKRAKQQITVKLYQDRLAMLDQYGRFIEDSRDYIIDQALDLVFKKDRDFLQWLEQQSRIEPGESQPANTSKGREPFHLGPGDRGRRSDTREIASLNEACKEFQEDC